MDEDEIVIIEDSTIIQTNTEENKSLNSSFSFTALVSTSTHQEKYLERGRSPAIVLDDNDEDDDKSLDSQIRELDKLISLKRGSRIEDTIIEKEISEVVPKKRKTENVEMKRAKEDEKERKRMEAKRKKEEKENEKEIRKIEREISAATNSKCELYTFCHIGKSILDDISGLEAELRMLFSERKIENQLIFENNLGTRIEWRRKCIELKEDDNGRKERFEYSSTQDLFAIVIPADTLKQVIDSESLYDFVVQQRSQFQIGRSTMIIISFGKLDVPKKKIHQLTIDIYERERAQITQISSPFQLALFCAQYLRSIARREKKRNETKSGEDGRKVQYLGQKGITTGSRDEIIRDWWSKMLDTVERLSDAQRRAILQLIPDPIKAIDKYKNMSYSDAIQEIGEIVAENGRRVGPVMAHRILTMLTDDTGNSIVE
ncbi:unnamed protein product [Caenorhabditis bovis]|uniref:ERCC4 domain-containing protein n=1 Tax=Caenorhabditis bovis TaxID=2654633 RepID=A0A8S1FFS1_9PELO|nr:unnamed protein product [Caenorhabditis bovis]